MTCYARLVESSLLQCTCDSSIMYKIGLNSVDVLRVVVWKSISAIAAFFFFRIVRLPTELYVLAKISLVSGLKRSRVQGIHFYQPHYGLERVALLQSWFVTYFLSSTQSTRPA